MTRVRNVGAPALERYPDASAAGSPEEEGPLFACEAHADVLVLRLHAEAPQSTTYPRLFSEVILDVSSSPDRPPHLPFGHVRV